MPQPTEPFLVRVLRVQDQLNAPKTQTNAFGKYKYRSNEDILEAVKPLLVANDLVLVQMDAIIETGGRIYVRAISRLIDAWDNENHLEGIGWAREEEDKKGMDSSQLTGATSSYARKYSLNGLFLIDDAKDADSNEVAAATKKAPKIPPPSEGEPMIPVPPGFITKTPPPPTTTAPPPRQGPPSGPPARGGITDKQRNFIFGLCREVGFMADDGHHDQEALDNYTTSIWGKPMAQLTMEEAGELIEELQSSAKAKEKELEAAVS